MEQEQDALLLFQGVHMKNFSRRNFILSSSKLSVGLSALALSPSVLSNDKSSIKDDSFVPQKITPSLCDKGIKDESKLINENAPEVFFAGPKTKNNCIHIMPFNGFIESYLVDKINFFSLDEIFSTNIDNIIITNLGQKIIEIVPYKNYEDFYLNSPLLVNLPPFRSMVITTKCSIKTHDASADGTVFLARTEKSPNKHNTWSKFFGEKSKSPLLISEQFILKRNLTLPVELYNNKNIDPIRNFFLSINLWWLPAGYGAGIHEVHRKNFLELHTQLYGAGAMQQFSSMSNNYADGKMSCDNKNFYTEYNLDEGNTHPLMAKLIAHKKLNHNEHIGDGVNNAVFFHYPPHQYYAKTNSVWVAFEYHEVKHD